MKIDVMLTEARKLHIIEAVLKTDDDEILKAIENLVEPDLHVAEKPAKYASLLGVISNEEANAMKLAIEENFEKVNPDDWK